MTTTIDELYELLARATPEATPSRSGSAEVEFSFLFFSDVHKDIPDARKYEFLQHLTLFADREGFTAVYFPERHFHEFGSIYANPAIIASYLIPQTTRVRFRTAGVSLPLHHPAEVVEWWSTNDVLSNGRVDLGFGSGWNKDDFIFAPDNFEDRKAVCSERIGMVQKLWRGEPVTFQGVGGEDVTVRTFPRPVQPELNVWLLVTANDEAFHHAGVQGYNVFTMLYGYNLDALRKKIARYRQGREEGGHDADGGVVTLMLHTLVYKDRKTVEQAVEGPFQKYIKSALNAHVNAGVAKGQGFTQMNEEEKQRVLEYSYHRYFKTCAIFGTVDEAREMVDNAIAAGVGEIACLVDFGADYALVKDSLSYLKTLVSHYLPAESRRITTPRPHGTTP